VGFKERDSLLAFLDSRREIISKYSEELTADEIESLALKTRGLIEDDIRKCVRQYIEKKRGTKRVRAPNQHV